MNNEIGDSSSICDHSSSVPLSSVLRDPTQKENYGDYLGDYLIEKNASILRYACCNVNGFDLKFGVPKDDKLTTICQEINSTGIDIMGMSEINTNVLSSKARDIVSSCLKKNFDHVVYSMSSGEIPSTSLFQQGGTMQLSRNRIVGRVLESFSDAMGRWSIQKIQGSENRVITFISVYQAANVPFDPSTNSTYTQQVLMMRAMGDSTDNPRTKFAIDLEELIKQCQRDGELIVLAGDFNAHFHSTELLPKMMDRVELVDIHLLHHPQIAMEPTYINGSNRIDYAFISQELVPAVDRCGFLPYHSHFITDHRCLYIDFDHKALLGIYDPLASVLPRDIDSMYPPAVRKYITFKHRYLKENGFFEMYEKLMKSEEPNHQLAEKLDRLWIESSILAGRHCSPPKKPWWSTYLGKVLESIRYLQSIRLQIKRKISMSHVKQYRTRFMQISYDPPSTEEEVQDHLRIAYKRRKHIRLNDRQKREDYLQEQAEAIAIATKKPDNADNIYQRLLTQERLQLRWKKINRTTKKKTSVGLRQVDVPTSWSLDGAQRMELDDPKKSRHFKTIDAPEEVKTYLQCRNKLHFGQAHGSPPTVPPLSHVLDWKAQSSTVEMVLEGDFDSDELSDLETILLTHCKKEDDFSFDEPPSITLKEWKKKIFHWKESTTTSPSGVHLGHAKALFARVGIPLENSGEDANEIRSWQRSLLEYHVGMLNYALKYQYSYDRWKKVTSVMIEKDPGSAKIHRLRVIHIYEYDYSLLLAIFWNKAMKDSELRGTIHAGQYGGRNGHDAQSLVYSEILRIETSVLARRNLIQFDNDASSCYDRIIPSLSSLIARKKGVHPKVVGVHATTLKEARYHLKTAFGVSDEYYQHCDAFPIYGTGQGSTNSPIIWMFISSVLFDMYSDNAYGSTFATPTDDLAQPSKIVGFVDDSNCTTNSWYSVDQEDYGDLIQMATEDAQLWADILWLSGGHLELRKCSFHFLTFKFSPLGFPSLENSVDAPATITIQDPQTKEYVDITRLEPDEPHKTLGHWIEPSLSGKKQLEMLHNKMNELTRRVKSAYLDRIESRLFYDFVFLPTFAYVLHQSTFKDAALRELERKTHVLSTRCGYQKGMSTAVRYGPTNLGGAGFCSFIVLQGEGLITNFLKHYRSNTMVSNTLKVALSWAQANCGVSFPILEFPKKSIPHLEGKYFNSLRSFLSTIDANISLHTTSVYPCQRKHDIHIMDFAIANVDKFKSKEDNRHILRKINVCRLYLNVVTFSDLTFADGVSIDPQMVPTAATVRKFPKKLEKLPGYPATGFVHYSFSKVNPVIQQCPNNASWAHWRTLMKLVHSHLEHHSLGPWQSEPRFLLRRWPFYFDPPTDQLFIRMSEYNDNGPLYRKVPYDPNSQRYKFSSINVDTPPDTSFPVHIDEAAISNEVVDYEFDPESDTLEVPPLVWKHDNVIQPVLRWPKPIAHFKAKVEALAKDGPVLLYACSDGSSTDDGMSYGFVISFFDGEYIAEGKGLAHGHPNNSYRAEAYGVAAMIRCLCHVLDQIDRSCLAPLQLYCDNKGVVDQLNRLLPHDEPFPNTTLIAEWDVFRQAQCKAKDLQVPFKLRHVKGHQDGKQSESPLAEAVSLAGQEDFQDLMPCPQRQTKRLSLEAQLNIYADSLTKKVDHSRSSSLAVQLQHNEAQLNVNKKTVSGKYVKVIRQIYSEKVLKKYIQKKYKWSKRIMESIDWEAHSAAIKSTSIVHQRIVKLLHEVLPTNKVMSYRERHRTPTCFRCTSGLDETTDHMIQCSTEEVQEWRLNVIQALTTVSTKEAAHHDVLLDIITTCLYAWMCDDPIPFKDEWTQYSDLITSQTSIGWRQLFRGRVSKLWAITAQQHNSSAHKGSGLKWIKKLITTIWDQFFILWENRNDALYRPEQEHDESHTKQTIRAHLLELHALRPKMIPADRDILLGDSATSDTPAIDTFVSTSSISRLKNWLLSRHPRIHASVKKARKLRIPNIQGIRTYFNPRPTPVSQPPHVQTRDNAHVNRLQEPPDIGTSPSLPRRIQSSLQQFFRR